MAIIYPDRRADQLGTLFIPNTLALIKGAPHRRAAEALAGLILSPEVEAALAEDPYYEAPGVRVVTIQPWTVVAGSL